MHETVHDGPKTTVKLYMKHVTVHDGPETTVKQYTMHVTVHGGPETTVKLYVMHGTVHGGPLQYFDTVGWAREEGDLACKRTGCWFVGDDDLTGALHDL